MSRAGKRGLVVGVGNAWAGDDAAGLLVARMVRERAPAGVDVIEHEGEPTALLDMWEGARLAVVVDATSGGGTPGAIHTFDASQEELPAGFTGTSTHAFGLAEAIAVARALGRVPERLVVVGIEGERFEAGAEPSAEVTGALERAAEEVVVQFGVP
jgi:hydrogenase maturation protease